MDLRIPYRNFTDANAAYFKVKSVLSSQGIEGFPVRPEFEFHDETRTVVAKGSGFFLKAEFCESDIAIDLQLGLLLKAFKDKVLQVVESKLKNVV